MIFNQLKKVADNFFFAVYPELCLVCGKSLIHGEQFLCIKCDAHLPINNFHFQEDNPVERVFWGRIPVSSATSLFSYNKDSNYRLILHELKYKSGKNVGVHFGERLGKKLNASHRFMADAIIPIPLHKAKLRKRGYNQSEEIANGVARTTGIPVISDAIIRIHNNSSQTKRGRYDRFQNSSDLFKTVKPELLDGKHLLIIDDVITTGSTIEAFVSEILHSCYCKFSIASLAYA